MATDYESIQQEEDQNESIWLTALPICPGTDLSSKLLLHDSEMKNIVISAVVGNGTSGDAYHVGSCDRHDGRKTDIVYLPNSKMTEDLPPVIVEIQKKINHLFVARAIHYCLDIFEETKVLPVLVVFNIDGFVGKSFFEKTFTLGNEPYYTLQCHPWAKSAFVFNMDSIADHMEVPLSPIVALTHFFTQKQRHLLALDEYDDPTMKLIYHAAYLSFKKNHAIELDKDIIWEDFCEVTALQFNKIHKAVTEDLPSSKKRIKKYAEDGILFANKMKRHCVKSDSTDVTPIENATDENKSEDLAFVERFRVERHGKMNWSQCHDAGKKLNLFARYNSYMALKTAFHRRTL